jgi:hypothetical protein
MEEATKIICSLIKDFPEVTIGKHINHTNFLIGKKVLGFIRKDGLALKLPPETVNKLLQKSTISRLVMGKKEMKEWVVIFHKNPEEYKADKDLLKESITFVSSHN